MPRVGPYFFVNGKPLVSSIDIENAELYGDFKISNASHYHVWYKNYYSLYGEEYDYYPRGRVVYKYKENKYILYADKCIDEAGIKSILAAFDLEQEEVIVDRTDLHYVCSRCNRYYVR